MIAATYAVKPGDTLTKQVPLSLFGDSGYSIEVYGPNGFYRAFNGRASSPHIEVRTSYDRRKLRLTGDVRVHLRNTGGEPANLTISDNAYKAATVTRRIGAGEEVSFSLHLKRSYSWYDFTVKANGADAEARFAGRVEAGRPGFSDPLMGGVV